MIKSIILAFRLAFLHHLSLRPYVAVWSPSSFQIPDQIDGSFPGLHNKSRVGCQVPKIECEDHAVRRRESHIVTFETSKGPGDGISKEDSNNCWDNLFYAHNCPITIVRVGVSTAQRRWSWWYGHEHFRRPRGFRWLKSWSSTVEVMQVMLLTLTYAFVCFVRRGTRSYPKATARAGGEGSDSGEAFLCSCLETFSLSSSSLSCSEGFWGQYQ